MVQFDLQAVLTQLVLPTTAAALPQDFHVHEKTTAHCSALAACTNLGFVSDIIIIIIIVIVDG